MVWSCAHCPALRVSADWKSKYSQIIIHVGSNDVRLRQSEVTKVNVESVHAFAKTMSDSVVFSGPLSNMASDSMFSCMSSFNRWLSRWCPANDVGFIDNWQTFWGRPGLIRRDGIHPTWEGAALISRNMAGFISQPNWQLRVEARKQSCSLTCFSVLPLESPTYNPIETVSVPCPHKFNKSPKSNKSSHKNLIKNQHHSWSSLWNKET